MRMRIIRIIFDIRILIRKTKYFNIRIRIRWTIYLHIRFRIRIRKKKKIKYIFASSIDIVHYGEK